MDKEKKKSQASKKIVTKKTATSLFKFFPGLSITVLIIAIGMFLYRAVFSPGYFTVDSTKLIWHDESGVVSSYKYNELSRIGIAENIIKLDIKTAASKIIKDHPEFKSCAIKRRFPDGLLIDIHARQPAALVDCGKSYLVDADAVLLSKALFKTEIPALQDLPVITGIAWKPYKKIGEKFDSPKLSKSLELLSAVKESRLLEGHSLLKINVSDHRNLIFFIDDNLQIKIGRDHYEERLGLLKETLSSSYIDKGDLEYIDLRFDDIVFGMR